MAPRRPQLLGVAKNSGRADDTRPRGADWATVGGTTAEQVAPGKPTKLGRWRWAWVPRRIALGFLTLFLVSFLVFAATQLLPGDPATAILGREATPERVAALNEELELNEPAPVQYADWLGGVITLDFGESLASREPVAALLGDRAVNTLVLVAITALITIPVSFVLGAWAAMRRDRPFDHAFQIATLGTTSTPDFVIGIMLIVLFATSVFQVLPAISLVPPGASPFSKPEVLVLPVATLVLATVPYLSRIIRATTIDVLDSDYIHMARMKGLSPRRVVVVHALPNVLVPAIQVTAVMLAYVAGGIVVIEFLFDYPGLGEALTEAVAARDVPVIQAVTLVLAAAYVVVNLLADILTVLVTPRLRTANR
jgi:peptide/nickel transport system permease protein